MSINPITSRRVLVTLFYFNCLFATLVSKGQDGFIVLGDDAFRQGKISFDARKPDILMFTTPAGTEQFTAAQITEFGYSNGAKFKSMTADFYGTKRRIFLEEIVSGKLKLFGLQADKPSFYIWDDSLKSIRSSDYLTFISSLAKKYPRWQEQYKLVKYKTSSLATFVRYHNASRDQNIPFVSAGAVVGYSLSVLDLDGGAFPENKFGDMRLSSNTLAVGLFIDNPFWKVRNLSMLTGLRFVRDRFSKQSQSSEFNQRIEIEQKNLDLLLQLKYTANARNFRPYIIAGGQIRKPVGSKSHLELEEKSGGSKILYSENFMWLPKFYIGYTAGAGVQIFYSDNHFLSVEFNYADLYADRDYHIGSSVISVRANF